MSKQRHEEKEIKNGKMIAIISAIIFLITTIIMSNNMIAPSFIHNSKILYAIYALIVVIATFISGIVLIATVEITIMCNLEKKKYRKKYETNLKKGQNLSNEFSKIEIRNCEGTKLLDIVPKEAIKCFAKCDENNNIVYKIQIDFENTTDDYVEFCDKFEIL